MQRAFEEVSEIYRREGLALGNTEVMADHIGVELNFFALLLARMEENAGQKSRYTAKAKAFIEEHLQMWVPAFTRDLENAAGYIFYKELAHATAKVFAVIRGEVLSGNASEGA